MAEIFIHDLADFPHWLPVISDWFHQEWYSIYGTESRTEIEQRMAGWLSRDSIPTALVAVANGEVVGTVALRDQMLGNATSSPVVESLFVVPHFRRQGIATKLLRAAENKARDIGLSKLYLFTQEPHAFYGASGWSRYQETAVHTTTVTVLEKWLTPQRLFQPPPRARRG
jgi:GNAT superfamily N-acetyltransferase